MCKWVSDFVSNPAHNFHVNKVKILPYLSIDFNWINRVGLLQPYLLVYLEPHNYYFPKKMLTSLYYTMRNECSGSKLFCLVGCSQTPISSRFLIFRWTSFPEKLKPLRVEVAEIWASNPQHIISILCHNQI